MNAFSLTLKFLAGLILLIAALHGAMGLGAEALLGVAVPTAMSADPSLDSQNRFYGLAFALYGVVLWFVAGDPARYFRLFGATLVVFFVAGLGRLLSIGSYGLPAAPIIALTAVELLAPPLLYVWGKKVMNAR